MSAADLEVLQLAERAAHTLTLFANALRTKIDREDRAIESSMLARQRLSPPDVGLNDEPPSRDP